MSVFHKYYLFNLQINCNDVTVGSISQETETGFFFLTVPAFVGLISRRGGNSFALV